ncbi:MAG: hypothetical protein ACFFDN_37660 [Candidatus Hodarchaeota archaeon]
MPWNIGFILKYFHSILFGNFDFFNLYNFGGYFKSKYKIDEKHISWISFSFFTLSLFFIGFQIFIMKNISLEGIIIELILIIASLRLFNYMIFLQFEEYCTSIETIGYFVINELLVILDTSCSLKESTKFIILSNYPVFSKIFEKAMISTHFGNPLEFSLKTQVKKYLHGNIQTVFLYILDIWENGKNIALLSKNRILGRISEKITEETDKIDSWASLSAGIIFLSPPVILCFLLLSGNMSVFLGLLIIISIVIGSFFIHPERHLTLYSQNNQIFLTYDEKSLEFLIILSENLLRGNSFDKSLNNALNIILNRTQQDYSIKKFEAYTQFRLGISTENELNPNFLTEFFPERILHLILLIKKFSMIDTFIAGKKLLTITEELNKTNDLLNKGISRLKAAKLHGNIVQVLALISLAFIAGASPFFLFVSNMLNHSFTKSSIVTNNSVYDLIYFVIALLISILPIRRVSVRRFENPGLIPLKEIFRLSKFLLFLVVFIIVKNALSRLII